MTARTFQSANDGKRCEVIASLKQWSTAKTRFAMIFLNLIKVIALNGAVVVVVQVIRGACLRDQQDDAKLTWIQNKLSRVTNRTNV